MMIYAYCHIETLDFILYSQITHVLVKVTWLWKSITYILSIPKL